MINQVEIEGWSEEEDKQLRSLLKKRLSLSRQKDYDLHYVNDLLRGEEKERKLVQLLNKAEVKTIYQVSKKGKGFKRVFVEFENRGKKSGISTTEADMWFFVLEGAEYNGEVVIGITPERLQRICALYEFEFAGDFQASLGKRVRLEDLMITNKEIEVWA